MYERAINNSSLKLYRRRRRVQVCKQARGESFQKPDVPLGFNPSPVGDFVDFQNECHVTPRQRGIPAYER